MFSIRYIHIFALLCSIDTNSIGDERMMEIISPTEGGGENAELSSLRDKIYSSPRSSDEKYAINETKSQDISLTRDIPDTRPDDCVNIEYDITSLPTIRYTQGCYYTDMSLSNSILNFFGEMSRI